VVRFRGDFTGLVRPARTVVSGFTSSHPGWAAFARARRAVGLGALLERFESTMREPEAIE
jgi:hypothetical protein